MTPTILTQMLNDWRTVYKSGTAGMTGIFAYSLAHHVSLPVVAAAGLFGLLTLVFDQLQRTHPAPSPSSTRGG